MGILKKKINLYAYNFTFNAVTILYMAKYNLSDECSLTPLIYVLFSLQSAKWDILLRLCKNVFYKT